MSSPGLPSSAPRQPSWQAGCCSPTVTSHKAGPVSPPPKTPIKLLLMLQGRMHGIATADRCGQAGNIRGASKAHVVLSIACSGDNWLGVRFCSWASTSAGPV